MEMFSNAAESQSVIESARCINHTYLALSNIQVSNQTHPPLQDNQSVRLSPQVSLTIRHETEVLRVLVVALPLLY